MPWWAASPPPQPRTWGCPRACRWLRAARVGGQPAPKGPLAVQTGGGVPDLLGRVLDAAAVMRVQPRAAPGTGFRGQPRESLPCVLASFSRVVSSPAVLNHRCC